MSPTVEQKPQAEAAKSMLFADPAPSDNNALFEKVQRKLKHQRDVQKRGANASHSGRRAQGSLARQNQPHGVATAGENRGPRSIPGRRKEKSSVMSPMLLSRSVPSGAQSWPPPGKASFDSSDHNLDPNWTLDGRAPLATSAPESSFLGRSFGSKREARKMTLFESAMIFNEAGNMLSHDNFNELGSSPELGPQSLRRKAKRRVGRHRPEKKKGPETGAGDRLSPDDVVLELMHVLLPGVDVTHELNMLFLGGSRHQGDVFHFEDDCEDQNNQVSHCSPALLGCKLLTIDVLKFQASLTKLLFGKHDCEPELPLVGTSSSELVEQFLSEQWIAKCMLSAVKLDVLAQYDAFAVLLAVYRALPSHRDAIQKQLVGVCLAIYDHQAMEHHVPTNGARKMVSMKGVIAMLNAILSVIEYEITETPDVFGDSPETIDEALDHACDRVVDSIKLLIRSSPGGTKTKSDENNQVEKYQEGSDSVEATTYGAMGHVIYRLTAFSPMHGEELLTWMLRKWPQRNVQLQLFFVRFMTGILVQFMIRGVFLPEDLVAKAFSRLRACIKSPHFLIAKEASTVCGNLPLMDLYLTNDQELREQVAAALHANATGHWNDRIRQMSDEYFDLLLDFA